MCTGHGVSNTDLAHRNMYLTDTPLDYMINSMNSVLTKKLVNALSIRSYLNKN